MPLKFRLLKKPGVHCLCVSTRQSSFEQVVREEAARVSCGCHLYPSGAPAELQQKMKVLRENLGVENWWGLKKQMIVLTDSPWVAQEADFLYSANGKPVKDTQIINQVLYGDYQSAIETGLFGVVEQGGLSSRGQTLRQELNQIDLLIQREDLRAGKLKEDLITRRQELIASLSSRIDYQVSAALNRLADRRVDSEYEEFLKERDVLSKKALSEMASRTKEESKAFLQEIGILDEEGQLAEQYR